MAFNVFPAANLTTSSGLAYLQDVYNRKEALDQLWEMFRFREPCEKFTLPKNSGLTYKVTRWNSMTAGTDRSTEGDQSTPLTIGNRSGTATVSQFTSFINLSDLLVDTAPDDIIASAAKQLGYRGGRTVNLMARNVFDSQAHNTNQNPVGTTLAVQDFRAARHGMVAANIKPFEGGDFLAYVHPLNSYDVVNDPAAGGLADIVKYTAPQNSALVRYNESGVLASVAGCKIIEDPSCYSFGSPKKYRTYIFGKGGVGLVDLAGRGPGNVTDPNRQNFNLRINRGGNNSWDPEGVIGGSVAYNFVTTVFYLSGVEPLGDVFRMRTIDTQPTISA